VEILREELITNINAVKVGLKNDYVWGKIPPGQKKLKMTFRSV